MKKYVLWILTVFFLGGCHRSENAGSLVVVSIMPQKYFVEKIAGNDVHVTVLVPPGASPETYSLMPSQMKDLSKARGWLKIGKIGFEQSWSEKIKQNNPQLKIIDTSVETHWITGSSDREGGQGAGVNPHNWMSPKEACGIIRETCKALESLFPEYRDKFDKNSQVLLDAVQQLDTMMTSRLGKLSQKKFLIFHPALTYLARDYGLEQIALENEGKEPSPSYMKNVVREAREAHIHTIFVQKEFDQDHAYQIAKEIQGNVVRIDPLSENWEQEMKLITDKLTANIAHE